MTHIIIMLSKMTLSTMSFSKMTLIIIAFSVMTLSTMAFSKMTLSIRIMTLSIMSGGSICFATLI